MAWTLQSILTYAARAVALDPSVVIDGADVQSEFTGYANLAMREIERAHRWPWLRSNGALVTVASTATVDMPADFRTLVDAAKPRYGTRGQGLPFEAVPNSRLDALRAVDPAAGGQPYLYAFVWNSTNKRQAMDLWPTPDAVYDLVVPYVRRSADLAALADVPQFPEHIQDLLPLATAALAQESRNALEAGAERGKFMAALQQEILTSGEPVRGQERTRLRQLCGEPAIPAHESDVIFVRPATI